MTTVDIYRGAGILVTIKPDDSSNQAKKVMGDNVITLTFEDSRNIIFKVNDYCTVYGEKYTLNALPVITKGSTREHKYTLLMQAEGFDLVKYLFLFLGSDNTLREAEFSLMGNTDTFVDLILANANRAGSGWIKGQVVPSGYKNLSFSGENCYNALARLAEEFETEFWIVGKTINLTKKSNDTGHVYKNEIRKGLYEITRLLKSDSSIITRLYAFGAEKNLPADYNNGARRLQMRSLVPVDEPRLIHDVTGTVTDNLDGTEDIVFDFTPATDPGTGLFIEFRRVGTSGDWIISPGASTSPRTLPGIPLGTYNIRFRNATFGDVTQQITVTESFFDPLLPSSSTQPQYYLEKNVATYGVREFTKYFDDIFPRRTGTVSSIDISSPYKFFDTSMDFDINLQLLPGIAPKITFNTGQLAGYTFDLSSYNNSTKEFVILKNKDEKILDVPSPSLKPAIGDKYVITDILLPQSYIDAAEAELKVAAQALLDTIADPQLSFNLTFDPVYLKGMNRQLNIGDLIWISDDELEIQRKIRIVSTTRNIVNEFQYNVEVSDTVSPGTISLIINAVNSSDRDISNISQQLLNNSILNNKVIGDLIVQLGTLIFENLPTTSTTTGFSQLYVEDATGKLHKKV
jgi:hypothetical protein